MNMKLSGPTYLNLICLTAGLGGFLFGFDTAVISGGINFLRIQFQLSAVMEGWIMSSALLGCVAGAAMAGWLADRFGRKMILLVSAWLFILSALFCAAALTPTHLVMARVIGGVGVGFAAMVAPMFISEIAPAYLRGRLVSLYQLAITLGILCSYLSNAWLLNMAHSARFGNWMDHYLVDEVWRGMLGSNMVPALLFFVFLLLVPESPRWLIAKDKNQKGFDILSRINGPAKAQTESEEIMASIKEGQGSIRELFSKKYRLALLIGLLLPFLSQLAGITTVMYYAPAIFEKAGFQTSSAMGTAAVIGFFNMIFTLVAIWKIDVWGRKPLLIAGFSGLSLALLLIGFLFSSQQGGYYLAAGFIFYIAVFAATLGPGVWVVIAEIYPTSIRGRAMSLATLSLFLGSTFVTQTYPLLRESVGIGIAFMLYGIVMIPSILFVMKFIPETKGRTLEQIEQHWKEEALPEEMKREVKHIAENQMAS
jgi:SP family arabinose:H+ symporter-like MFS transporter